MTKKNASMLEKISGKSAFVIERALQWVSIGIERLVNTENFVVADQTPHDIIYQKGLLSVRKYPALTETEILIGDKMVKVSKKRHKIPVVLIPPLAADPLNFDLMPHRSLVRFLMAHGYKVYLVDFGSPDDDHSHLGLVDYTTIMIPDALKKIRTDSRQKELTLLGYCMGGLFSLIYAGWSHDKNIRNIVTIASPIDMHQAGAAGRLWEVTRTPVRLVRRFTSFRIHNIDPSKLNVPGWVSSLIFKATNPMGTITGYIDLLMNLWDRDYVTEYQTMSTWFNKMHAYPGGIIQDFIVRVGIDNALATGNIKLGHGKGKHAALDKIESSLLAIAGKTDKIVTVDAAKKVMDIVGSADKEFMLAPGGHAGVFAGSKAPLTTWVYANEWLATRSA